MQITMTYKTRTEIRWYNGNRLKESRSFPQQRAEDSNCSTLSIDGSKWECEYNISAVPDREDAKDIKVTFRLAAGTSRSTGVAVAFDFERWAIDNYVLMPAAVYNGNRFRSLPIRYPPLFRDPADHRLDLPITITDVPRLNVGNGSSRIQQTTGDLSTPAIGFHDPHAKQGFWLLTRQQTRFGNSGLSVEESDDRSRATFMVTAPCVRETRQSWDCQVPGEDRGADWKEGDEVTIHLRLYSFPAPQIQTLFDRFAEIRKDLTGATVLRHILPFSSAWDMQEEKYNDQNWREERGYYSVALLEEKDSCDWQLGWAGGCMVTLPLLFTGHEKSRQRALRNLDTILTRTQAPSGFFYGIGNGKEWYCDGFSEPHPRNMHMVRKSADALYFFIKQILLLEKQDSHWRIPETWKTAVSRLADAFAGVWDRYGQFGQFVDVETGDIVVGGSTAGAIAPGALALAGQYFDSPRYLEVAKAAGRFYYQRDVKAGVTTGGPGEILQCPDSESAFAMLESLVVLYEITQEQEWLSAAEEMARQCTTWCVSYDYTFPTDSLFGRLDMRSAGAVYANVQNKHAAPGICTLSGDSLLKLYRATGNRFHLELLQDIAHNITQYVSRKDRPIEKMLPGWINERVNLSDWEGPNKVGEIFYGSCWCEVSCMLTSVEVPGLYVQPDTGLVCAIDHIEAEMLDHHESQITVRLSNPCSFSARVRVLVESSKEAGKPLGFNALLNNPVIALEPGEQKDFLFNLQKDKTIIQRIKQ